MAWARFWICERSDWQATTIPWNVRKTDSGFRFVNVLTTGTLLHGAVNVNADVLFLDLDIDVFVDNGH